MNLILLGDSIFDNKSYVGSGPDVVAQLRRQMANTEKSTLCAIIDGNVVGDVPRQLQNVPSDATHLLISAGGNDALRNTDVLQMQVSSSAEFFGRLADIADAFEARYQAMLHSVFALNLLTTLCTIYYPRSEDALMQKLAVAGLASFNDVIIKQAFLACVPLIDLRLLCDEAGDYANEIEPSVMGGEKSRGRFGAWRMSTILIGDKRKFISELVSVCAGGD